ncbi:hypothetical protein GCM10023147_45770 [Tsukamurella soli]|uniref:Uncharacterized protein n=1 Tax=Tsukamurella soli TaxID=644556 RepID=A0ABP8KCU2_9ACTN
MDMMFDLFVVDEAVPPGDVARAIERLRALYSESPRVGAHQLWRPEVLRVGLQTAPVDLAVVSGQVAQIVAVVPFDREPVTDTRAAVAAWSLAVARLRRIGGLLEQPGRAEPAPVARDVPVGVLVLPPRTDAQRDACAVADQLWGEVDADVVGPGQMHRLVELAERRLVAA